MIGFSIGEVNAYYWYYKLRQPDVIARLISKDVWEVAPYISANPVNTEAVALWLKNKTRPLRWHQQLQWKLSLFYTLVTVVLILIGLGIGEVSGHDTIDSEKTVKSHVGNILSKLHLADRTQAAVYAWRRGLVE